MLVTEQTAVSFFFFKSSVLYNMSEAFDIELWLVHL